MMRSSLLVGLIATMATQAQTVLLEESFDTWAEGSGMATNDPGNWAIWAPGEDQVVTAAFAQSGTNSLACISDNVDGGPGDLLLLLGDRTTGIYDLSWSMYIPAGKGGYFNVLHAEDVTPSGSYALEVKFAGGTLTATADNADLTGTYPSGEWFDILLDFDLDNAGAVLFVNSQPVITWPFDTETDGTAVSSQLGAVDFYSYADGTDTGEYYVDDIQFVQQSAGGIGMAENSTNGTRVFPSPAQDVLFVNFTEPLSQQASVQLMDVTGQVLMAPTAISSRTLRFSVANLAAGIYFVRITDGDRRIVERAVKN